MRVLLSAVGLIVLTLGTAHARTDWTVIAKSLAKQVPRLEIEDASGKGVCAGVVVNAKAGFALTCAHCTGTDDAKVSITLNGRHAKLARANTLLDLAVVRFNHKDEQEMPLAEETGPIGTEIAIAGFMLAAEDLHVQFGRIASRKGKEGGIVVDGVVLPGDSGGALVNAAGQLVGINNRYYGGTAVGIAIPVEKIRDFVEMYLPVKP
jgi:S1-C subfamily serine protease